MFCFVGAKRIFWKSIQGENTKIQETVQESWGFLDGSVIKTLPANAGVSGDAGLIPGSGRSPGEGKSNPFQFHFHFHYIMAWEIPWTEEPGGLQSMESQSQIRLSNWACTRKGYLSCHFWHPPLWSNLPLPSVSPCLCALGTDCQPTSILVLVTGEGNEELRGIENQKWSLPAR